MEGGALERLQKYGVGAASPIDLIAVALASSPQDVPSREEAAAAILRQANRLKGIASLGQGDLDRHTASPFEALRFVASLELGRRTEMARHGGREGIDGPEDVEAIFAYLRDERKEHFCALYLDAKNQVLARSTVHVGTLTMSVVGPREVFREAIREGAAGVVVVHNHPSGDPSPSPEDLAVTQKLKEVGAMLDIPLLDHIVIGHQGSVSLRRMGAL